MTLVRIRKLQNDATGAQVPLKSGYIDISASRRVVTSEGVIDVIPFRIHFSGVSTASIIVDLAATDDTWCWVFAENLTAGVYPLQRTVRKFVPESGATLDYESLVDADPTTLPPNPEPTAAWYAALSTAIAGITTGSVAALDIVDSTDVGRALLTAGGLTLDARLAAARAAIGAGTSSVAIGNTDGTAADGAATATALDAKANVSALAALAAVVDSKVSSSDLYNLLASKADITATATTADLSSLYAWGRDAVATQQLEIDALTASLATAITDAATATAAATSAATAQSDTLTTALTALTARVTALEPH